MASLSTLNGRVVMSQHDFEVNREDGGGAIGPR